MIIIALDPVAPVADAVISNRPNTYSIIQLAHAEEKYLLTPITNQHRAYTTGCVTEMHT